MRCEGIEREAALQRAFGSDGLFQPARVLLASRLDEHQPALYGWARIQESGWVDVAVECGERAGECHSFPPAQVLQIFWRGVKVTEILTPGSDDGDPFPDE